MSNFAKKPCKVAMNYEVHGVREATIQISYNLEKN